MSYYHEDNAETDERFGEHLDEAVERIAREARSVAKSLDENVERMRKRHQLAREMAAAERFADIPTKTLEKRLLLIRQICSVDHLANEDVNRLQERLSCLEAI